MNVIETRELGKRYPFPFRDFRGVGRERPLVGAAEYVHDLASFLRQHGAEAVSVAAIDYVYTSDNPLYAKLAAELDRPR